MSGVIFGRRYEPGPHDPQIVLCPTCGRQKWKYLGGDLDAEPPCSDCQRGTA